jgi:hypothetical protein
MTGRGLAGAYLFLRTIIGASLLIALDVREPALIVLAVVVLVVWAGIELSRRLEPRTGGSAWWAGVLMPIGLGVWASFLYIGARTHRWQWVLSSAVYLSMIVFAGYLNVLWKALHAYAIRGQVQRALSATAP